MLYGKQKQQAKQIAQSLLDKGVNPDWKVRVNYYPDISPLADEEIIGLTEPVDPMIHDCSFLKYYSVKELAEM